MCRIMEELIRGPWKAEKDRMMKNGKLSLTQAMDLLGLDEKDRKLVAEHLDQ